MYSRVAPPDGSSDACTSGANILNTKNEYSEGNVSLKDVGQSSEGKPSHVSTETWQKFQKLKERRKELCKESPDQKKEKAKRPRNRKEPGFTSETEIKTRSEIFSGNRSSWKELCQNIDINAHLNQESIAREKPKTKLEEEIDKAMKDGDFTKAEAISDQIVRQDLGVKIVGAVEVRDYKKRKEIEEKTRQVKKKKKLVWGFEQKERWESKGNM